MQSNKVKIEVSKWEDICFIAGKYVGKKGWVNLAMKYFGSAHKIQVLVDRSDARKRAMIASFVYRSSITLEKSYKNATTLATAVGQKCPDIEEKLIAVCREFVVAEFENTGGVFWKLFQNLWL